MKILTSIVSIITIWNFIFKNDEPIVHNKKSTTNVDSSINIHDNSINQNFTDSSTTIINNTNEAVAYSNQYDINGVHSEKLINYIKSKDLIDINPNSSNKIVFDYNGEIYQYSDSVKNIFISTQGYIKITINGCSITLNEFVIEKFGPSIKSEILKNIEIEMKKIIDNNASLVWEKIEKCID